MVIVALILFAACGWLAAGWWETHRELAEALERAASAEKATEDLLSGMCRRNLAAPVDTCQRTQGSKR